MPNANNARRKPRPRPLITLRENPNAATTPLAVFVWGTAISPDFENTIMLVLDRPVTFLAASGADWTVTDGSGTVYPVEEVQRTENQENTILLILGNVSVSTDFSVSIDQNPDDPSVVCGSTLYVTPTPVPVTYSVSTS